MKTPQHVATMGNRRVEASIMGESALIDRESGRVYWEGGSSSTAFASIVPKLTEVGVVHVKATILSFLLFVALLGLVTSSLRRRLSSTTMVGNSGVNYRNGSFSEQQQQCSPYVSFLVFLLKWTVPKFDDRFVAVIVVLYFLEAYTCNTRRYLTNALSSPTEIEEYIEKLRNEPPTVEWTVRCFHYETFGWRWFTRPWQYFRGKTSAQEEENGEDDASSSTVHARGRNRSRSYSPSTFLTRKVVTHIAKGTYRYSSWVDSTIAGVWKRATSATYDGRPAPFTKVILSKVLVLSNKDTRRDYFRQQSNFVTSEGQKDEYAEFGTNIQVQGFKSRMLAIRPVEGIPSAKLFRLHLFWIFTLLGLTVPYRIWFSRHSDQVRVTVVKETLVETAVTYPSWRTWFTSSSKSLPRSPLSYSDGIFRKRMQDMVLYTKEQQSLIVPNHTNETIPDPINDVNEILVPQETTKAKEDEQGQGQQQKKGHVQEHEHEPEHEHKHKHEHEYEHKQKQGQDEGKEQEPEKGKEQEQEQEQE